MLIETPAYALGLLAAGFIGMSKSGFSGVSLISVFLFAHLYGARPSVGLVLPLLIAADLLAYPAYLRHGSWRPVWRLLVPALVGIGIGWWWLGHAGDEEVKRGIGCCILLMVAVQAGRKWRPGPFGRLAASRGFGTAAGLLGGFATMLANAAGPVIQMFLIARGVPKMELVGIGARFFLLVNLLKIPLNTRLALITPHSLLDNLTLLPGVVAGVYGGRWLLKHMPPRWFEAMVTAVALVAGLRLLLG